LLFFPFLAIFNEIRYFTFNHLIMISENIETIDKRTRIPFSAIENVIDQIANRYSPEKIILFGSYAKNNPHPESDVDLLVVMKTNSPIEHAIDILQNVEHHFGMDIIVKSGEEIERRISLGDFFLRDIIESGRVVYERPR